ncbi:S1 family peptidase [Streptosporangium jomthongense]|uniref:S1 family peptidase n=1 Tax=Streptosporangium jomthongense TaxID=1193683 RepID=A0ABV8FBQ2_9ACTN
MKSGLAFAAALTIAIPLIPGLAMAQPGSAAKEPITLSRDQQPKADRPTLNRLSKEAKAQGISLKQALDKYAAKELKNNPSIQGDMPDGPVPDPTIKVDGIPFSELIDLNRYAQSEKISFEEAIDRYAWSPAINPLASRLRSEFAEVIADIAIVDEGRGVRIGFKGEVPAKALELAKTLPVEVRLFPGRGFSEAELQAAREAALLSLHRSGKVASTVGRYNAETGEVNITVRLKEKPSDDAARSRAVTSIQPSAPDNPAIKINIQLDDNLLLRRTDKYIRGGGLLNGSNNCTNGFNVISSTGAKGSLTARHCADGSQYYTYRNHSNYDTDTTTLSRWFRAQDYDLARYDSSSTTSMTQTRTFYYDWNLPRYAHDVGTSPVVGQPVCKFGRTTGATCDNITDTNVDISDEDWITDGKTYKGNIVTDDMVDPGDSGGPLYYGNRAWGITSAESYSVFDTSAYFVATDRVNDSTGLGSNWNVWTCPTC